MFDWQVIVVALIVLAALLYTGQKVWARLRSFKANRTGDSSCATGCGSCGSEQKPKSSPPRTVFVEITRSNITRRKAR